MKTYPIQSSFEFGQVSWKFYSRSDLGIHGRGLDVCRNMITDPRGPIESRGGFDELYEDNATTGSFYQVVDFVYSEDKAFLIVFYNVAVHIINIDTGVRAALFSVPYTEPEIREIHTEMQDGNTVMYFAHGNHVPYEVIYDPVADTWVWQPIVFISMPTEWVTGSYPSTVAFGQGRSWWGGNKNNPQTVFGSRSYTVAGYSDMTTGPLATDGFKFNITRRGKIEWINEAKNMLVGFNNSEHILSSEGLIIKTGDIGYDEQSGYGSKSLKPYRLGLETFYLSPDGKKIRSMWYTNEEDYVSQDITYVADGEFTSPIKKFTLSKKPDMVIWCVLEDGSMASCTYFKEATDTPIIGWHFHTFAEGFVTDVVSVERGSKSELIITMTKTINGTDSIVIEKYNIDSLLDAREIEDHTGSPSNIITGHYKLANKTIQVLADGAVHPDITLDSSGDGTINYPAEIIELGYSFLQEMKTLPYISQGNQGTNASWKKRPNKIVVRVHESSYPLINGIRPPDRRMDDLMDEPVPLFTGDISAANSGYDEFGQVTISQDLPLKLVVTAILGDMGQSSL